MAGKTMRCRQVMTAKERKTRVVRTTEERRAEIVAAALECLQEVGYARLTARLIAERSQISLGHITYHFRDMKEVLIETYRHASSLLLAATLEDVDRSSPDPLERLAAFLGAGFAPEFLKPDYLRVRIDLWSAALAHEELAQTERALYDRYRRSLAEMLDKLAEGSGAGQAEVGFVTDAIMATLDGLWLDWVRRRDSTAVRNGLAACVLLARTVLSERRGGPEPEWP